MSNSNIPIKIPSASIPSAWLSMEKKLAVLAEDLFDLIRTYDGIIHDLLYLTNPTKSHVAKVWGEIAAYINSYHDKIIVPLHNKLHEMRSKFQSQIGLDGAPASYFLDGTTVTYGSILDTLYASQTLSEKLLDWEVQYPVSSNIQ